MTVFPEFVGLIGEAVAFVGVEQPQAKAVVVRFGAEEGGQIETGLSCSLRFLKQEGIPDSQSGSEKYQHLKLWTLGKCRGFVEPSRMS